METIFTADTALIAIGALIMVRLMWMSAYTPHNEEQRDDYVIDVTNVITGHGDKEFMGAAGNKTHKIIKSASREIRARGLSDYDDKEKIVAKHALKILGRVR